MQNLFRHLPRLALAVLAALAIVPAAHGQFVDVYYVTNLNDDGPGSLRQAIVNANATDADSVIEIEVSGELELANVLPPITGAVNIDGAGQTFVIDGQDLYRGLIIRNVPVTVSGLTIQKGKAFGAQPGGGIASDGSLTLNSVTVRDSTNSGQGGGVYAAGPLTITGSLFEANGSGAHGGGVYAGGPLIVTSSTFRYNACAGSGNCHGGGLYTANTLTLTDTQFISNTANGLGGGAFALTGAQVDGGLFEDNYSKDFTFGTGGGGLYAERSLVVTGTQFISNTAWWGGGVMAYDSVLTDLTNAHFENNRALNSGGGLALWPAPNTTTLTNVSFVGNEAYNGGGMIAASVVITGGRFERNTDVVHAGGLLASYAVITGTAFISNTSAAGRAGGAYLVNEAHITGAVFAGNSAPDGAGGLAVGEFNGHLTLADSRFDNNQGSTGGGVFATGALAVTSTVFLANSARVGGGLAHTAGNGQLANSLFAGNTAAEGGAALSLSGTGTDYVKHLTIGNSLPIATSAISTTKEIVHLQNVIITDHAVGLDVNQGFVAVNNALFHANGQDIAGDVAAESDRVTGDPLFVNPAGGDYHLQPGSPAVDAGIDAGLAVDFDGDPRPLLQGYDIGFDEAVDAVALHRLLMPLLWR